MTPPNTPPPEIRIPANLKAFIDAIKSRNLQGAACTGRSPHFDLRIKDETNEDRHLRWTWAKTVCKRCPARINCDRTAKALPKTLRSGIWAGVIYDENGKPKK